MQKGEQTTVSPVGKEDLSPASCRDWTLDKYAALCRTILASHYVTRRVDEFMAEPTDGCVVLRHDVDRFPVNALAMARLEHALGIAATYYVRKVPSAYSDDLVSGLHALGHEVGYHYEVLSKTGGDMGAAGVLFAQELSELRALAPVRTASSHGSPLSGWDSLDLWQKHSPTDFDLLGEAYLQIDYRCVGYYTDTGRSWSADAVNLRDRVGSANTDFPVARSTDDLMAVIESCGCPSLCVQTHPERWNRSASGFARSLALDWAANSAKRLIRTFRASHAR